MLRAARGLTGPDVRTESELASELAVSRGLLREVSQQHRDEGLGGGAEVGWGPSEPARGHTKSHPSSGFVPAGTPKYSDLSEGDVPFSFTESLQESLGGLRGRQEPALLLPSCSVIPDAASCPRSRLAAQLSRAQDTQQERRADEEEHSLDTEGHVVTVHSCWLDPGPRTASSCKGSWGA